MQHNPNIVLAFWADCGLPSAQAEFRFHPKRKWKFDFAFAKWGLGSGISGLGNSPDAKPQMPGAMLAIEVQGGIWTRGRHTRGSGLVKEYEKLNAAAVAGWRILYCTPQEIGTLKFARTVAEALKFGQQTL